MTIDLKDIVTISGYSGLFKIISPARHGLLVESLDEHRQRSVKHIQNHRIANLEDIGIYTTDEKETLPLSTIFERLYAEFAGSLSHELYDTPDRLQELMARIAPEYDAKRVYVSYSKKIIHWYCLLIKYVPELFSAKEPTASSDISQ